MINFHRWSDNAYQFVFEGNSFYYCHSICMAFREKGSKTVYIKGRLFSGSMLEMVDALSMTGTLIYMNEKDFYDAANGIYAKSLLKGIRRVGLDILFCKNKKDKGEQHVTDFKSDAG